MINVSQENNPELYFDYRLGLNLLKEIKDENCSYPDEPVIFHIYTEVKTAKELECVKSFGQITALKTMILFNPTKNI